MVKEKKALSKKALERIAKKEQKQKEKDVLKSDGMITKAAVLQQAVITGNLASRPDSRDLKVDQFSVTTYGKQLVQDTVLELNHGRRYGLIGQNGSGKSTILAAIAAKEIPVPDSIDMWFLDHEAPPSEMTAVEAVTEKAKAEHDRLEKLTLELLEDDPEKHAELIDSIGEKLEKMDPHTFDSCGRTLIWSRFRNHDDGQKNQRYVRWVENEGCSRSGLVCAAHVIVVGRTYQSFGLGSLRLVGKLFGQLSQHSAPDFSFPGFHEHRVHQHFAVDV